MPKYDFEKFRKMLKSTLSNRRFEHCMRVSNYASLIADYLDLDVNKAKIAGLLHDCGKEIGEDNMVELCVHHNLPIWKNDVNDAHNLHGVAGAIIAHEDFGIEDVEILTAIANHSGRPDMSVLEKIIFIADASDSFLQKNIDAEYIYDGETLDEIIIKMIRPALEYCVEKNIYMAERTQDAFDFIIFKNIVNNYADKNFFPDIKILDSYGNRREVNSEKFEDEVFANAIKINLERGIKLDSLSNFRDLGGYMCEDGKSIVERKLFRSAHLNYLSKEDSDKLHELGIRTIIDLRDPKEIQKSPDKNIDKFVYINTPLPLVDPELDWFRERILERKQQTFSKNEDIWYNVLYFINTDIDEMYTSILFDKNSIAQLRNIFNLLLESDGGVLLHCTSGKDRTGIVMILILYLLGVPYEDIRNDYFASMPFGYANMLSVITDMYLEGYGQKAISSARKFFSLSVDTLPKIYEQIENKYKTFDNYLIQELKITDDDVRSFNEKFKILKPLMLNCNKKVL